jgi:hypothetical protein
MRSRTSLLAAALAFGALAAPAGAASVVYTDGGNVVVASPDGARKLPLTTDGTPGDPYFAAAQAADGTTVAARLQTLDKRRPVLHKFSAADGKPAAANVMPAYSGATALVAPLGIDIDAAGKTVAFGYSYCAGLCGTRQYGYWLTYSDHGPANPSNPQGSSGLYAPSFYGNRIVSSDGFKIMVQEPLNAPFNDGHAGWISPGDGGARFWAAEVQPGARQIALEYAYQDTWGIVIARGDGTLGGATELTCFLPATGAAEDVSYSPDGKLIAWKDGGGVKVAGAPDLAKPLGPGDTCALSSPAVVISASGVDPNLGGADVAAMIAARGGGGGGGVDGAGGGGGGGGAGDGGGPAGGVDAEPSIAVVSGGRIKLGRRMAVRVRVPGAGSVSATLKRGRRVVASGTAKAAGAAVLRVPLKARVRLRTLRGRKLALRVRWTGPAGATAGATTRVTAR